MAQGYARATGKVGVAIATSGPGATNLVTPIADAYLDSTPIVCITGQVPTHLIGTDAFQEADIQGITMPIVKHSWLVSAVEDIPQIFKEAFHIARSGRPGPVLIDIPKDLQLSEFEFSYPRQVDIPGYKPSRHGHPRQIITAAEAILAAERPTLYVGGGAINCDARRADRAGRGGPAPGGDHADGEGRRTRQPPAVHRPARHARLAAPPTGR